MPQPFYTPLPRGAPRRSAHQSAHTPVRWLARVLPLLGCMAMFCAPPPLLAQGKATSLMWREARVTLENPVGAVAINADESIIAAAGQQGGDGWKVVLIDRPSRGRLGIIDTKVGRQPRLRFSPVADLLLIGGSKAQELWSLPISPMNPERPLEKENLQWRVEFAANDGPGQARFGTPPGQVYWLSGGALYRRAVDSSSQPPAGPVWRPEDGAILAFAFDPRAQRAALVIAERKEVALLDTGTLHTPRRLAAHRFMVSAAGFIPGQPLMTLDQGRNLVRWGQGGKAPEVSFLNEVPQDFRAAGLLPLGPEHMILPGSAQGAGALVLAIGDGRLATRLEAAGPENLAVSPTGRYLVTASGNTVHLFGFARPLPPLRYVRALRAQKAYQTAQNYVRLMDPHGISPQLKADLLNEVGQEPRGKELRTALTRLRQSGEEGNAVGIRRWAGRVLQLHPGHPEALAALKRLRESLELEALQRAREAFNSGEHKVAISLLANRIPEDSPNYPDAAKLIRAAEARRSVETVLKQAHERLQMGNPAAARALVNEALRKEPAHPEALALMERLDEENGSGMATLAVIAAAIAAGLALIGFLAVRYRRNYAPIVKKMRLDDDAPPRPMSPRRENPRPSASAQRPHREQTTQRPANGGRQSAGTARRQVVNTLLENLDQTLRRLQTADLQKLHTTLLMGLEAELQSIRRQLDDPTSELGKIHQRLRAIGARLQSVRSAPPPPEESPAQDGEPTYYDLLNLEPDASLNQIRVAYHEKLKQYHPDRHNASEFDWVKAESERMSRRLSEAYEVLSDAGRRSRYDRELQRTRGRG